MVCDSFERAYSTYPSGRRQGVVDIEEADGVLERTILEGRIRERHGEEGCTVRFSGAQDCQLAV